MEPEKICQKTIFVVKQNQPMTICQKLLDPCCTPVVCKRQKPESNFDFNSIVESILIKFGFNFSFYNLPLLHLSNSIPGNEKASTKLEKN